MISNLNIKEFYCDWCGKREFFQNKKHAKKCGWLLDIPTDYNSGDDFCSEKCRKEALDRDKNKK